jgi:LPXTG-motif cell wall-anchored protein
VRAAPAAATLPVTGSDIAGFAIVALVLLGTGVALVTITRRRRPGVELA